MNLEKAKELSKKVTELEKYERHLSLFENVSSVEGVKITKYFALTHVGKISLKMEEDGEMIGSMIDAAVNHLKAKISILEKEIKNNET